MGERASVNLEQVATFEPRKPLRLHLWDDGDLSICVPPTIDDAAGVVRASDVYAFLCAHWPEARDSAHAALDAFARGVEYGRAQERQDGVRELDKLRDRAEKAEAALKNAETSCRAAWGRVAALSEEISKARVDEANEWREGCAKYEAEIERHTARIADLEKARDAYAADATAWREANAKQAQRAAEAERRLAACRDGRAGDNKEQTEEIAGLKDALAAWMARFTEAERQLANCRADKEEWRAAAYKRMEALHSVRRHLEAVTK